MILGEKDLELLAAYYEGELSEQECRMLEKRLSSDKEFLEAANDLWAVAKQLDNYRHRDLLAKMKQWDEEAGQSRVEKKSIKPAIIVLMVIAIVSIAFLIAWWFWQGSSAELTQNQRMADNAFIEYGVRNSGLSDLGGSESDGYRHFDQKRYREAIVAFEEVMKKEPGNLVVPYYLGVAYLGNHKAEKAIPLLVSSLSNELIDPEECQWNLALCYLSIGSNEKALLLLKELAEKGQQRKADAADLINKIK